MVDAIGRTLIPPVHNPPATCSNGLPPRRPEPGAISEWRALYGRCRGRWPRLRRLWPSLAARRRNCAVARPSWCYGWSRRSWPVGPAASAATHGPAARPQPTSRRCARIARRTWRFFERFVTPDDNMLPPDNFQEDPRPVVAHRTSPTNIGLYLLSVAAARDFGWIGLPPRLSGWRRRSHTRPDGTV